jgi:hypothetical protein
MLHQLPTGYLRMQHKQKNYIAYTQNNSNEDKILKAD